MLCHDGAFGNPNAFTVAGTIYVDAAGASAAQGATVTLESHDGTQFTTRQIRSETSMSSRASSPRITR